MNVGRHRHRRLTFWHGREEVLHREFGQGLELSDDLVGIVGHVIKDHEEEGEIDFFSHVECATGDEESDFFFAPPEIHDLLGVGFNAGDNRGLQACVCLLYTSDAADE